VAGQRIGSSANAVEASLAGEDPLHRLTNLVALLLVKGEPQPDQIRILAAAGYRNTEIAALLGLTSNAVKVALYRMRSKG
jgi:hypothetical protein